MGTIYSAKMAIVPNNSITRLSQIFHPKTCFRIYIVFWAPIVDDSIWDEPSVRLDNPKEVFRDVSK